MVGKTVLMVEGNDDVHVVKNICGARDLGKIDEIRPYGGKATLIEGISVAVKESDVVALGIVLDADTDIEASWRSVAHKLTISGYQNVPQIMPAEGLILPSPAESLLPKVGVWLMPDNKTPGILEDFLAFLVPPGDLLFAYVRDGIDALPHNLVRFSHEKKPKTLIHAWLSVQEEPGRPMGQAISAKYLDPNLEHANPFVDWLRQIFFHA